ncbi:helix-turn-helix domain-containing protein [Streptomyces sp. Tue6028]|uniref:helix-turn-helix domain-containing protein n=1 Tax=Streptomyces sp. Tue6028 TaxID=2036037 RepID=UPI003F4A3FF4
MELGGEQRLGRDGGDVGRFDESPGELCMASIARSVGYSSPYAFTAAFRRHHGEPPGAWRQRESQRAKETQPSGHHTH